MSDSTVPGPTDLGHFLQLESGRGGWAVSCRRQPQNLDDAARMMQDQLSALARTELWRRLQECINRDITLEVVREMLIDPTTGQPTVEPCDHFSSGRELAAAVLQCVASAPTAPWRQQAHSRFRRLHEMAEQTDEIGRRRLLMVAARRLGRASHDPSAPGAQGFRHRLIPLAYVKNVPDHGNPSRRILNAQLEDAYQRSHQRFTGLLDAVMGVTGHAPDPAYFGPGPTGRRRGLEAMAVIAHAAFQGERLRESIEPADLAFELPSERDGAPQDWHAPDLALSSLLSSLTVPVDPHPWEPDEVFDHSQVPPGWGDSPADQVVCAAHEMIVQRVGEAMTELPDLDALTAMSGMDSLSTSTLSNEFWYGLVGEATQVPPPMFGTDVHRAAVARVRRELGSSVSVDQMLMQVCRQTAQLENETPVYSKLAADRLACLAFLDAIGRGAIDNEVHPYGQVVGAALAAHHVERRRVYAGAFREQSERFGLRPRATLFGDSPEQQALGYETLALMALITSDGLFLRRGIDPGMHPRTLPSGPGGVSEDWTLAGLAYGAYLRAALEVAPTP